MGKRSTLLTVLASGEFWFAGVITPTIVGNSDSTESSKLRNHRNHRTGRTHATEHTQMSTALQISNLSSKFDFESHPDTTTVSRTNTQVQDSHDSTRKHTVNPRHSPAPRHTPQRTPAHTSPRHSPSTPLRRGRAHAPGTGRSPRGPAPAHMGVGGRATAALAACVWRPRPEAHQCTACGRDGR